MTNGYRFCLLISIANSVANVHASNQSLVSKPTFVTSNEVDTIQAAKESVSEIIKQSNAAWNDKQYKLTQTHVDELIMFLNRYPSLIDYVVCESLGCDNKAVLDLVFHELHADINMQFLATGYTPIHYAVIHKLKTIHYLLGYKDIDVNIPDYTGKTPLHSAVLSGNISRVLLLLDQPNIFVDAKDQQGFTPLHHAVIFGLYGKEMPGPHDFWAKKLDLYVEIEKYNPIIQRLISAGCSKEEKNIFGETPLDLMRQLANQQTGKAKILLDNFVTCIELMQNQESIKKEWRLPSQEGTTTEEAITKEGVMISEQVHCDLSEKQESSKDACNNKIAAYGIIGFVAISTSYIVYKIVTSQY